MTEQNRSSRRALVNAAIAEDTGNTDETITYLAADLYEPNVPVSVRDGVYWATLATAAASALASGVAGIWFPDIAAQVLATGGVATTVMGIIGGGVGVVYRPGARR